MIYPNKGIRGIPDETVDSELEADCYTIKQLRIAQEKSKYIDYDSAINEVDKAIEYLKSIRKELKNKRRHDSSYFYQSMVERLDYLDKLSKDIECQVNRYCDIEDSISRYEGRT